MGICAIYSLQCTASCPIASCPIASCPVAPANPARSQLSCRCQHKVATQAGVHISSRALAGRCPPVESNGRVWCIQPCGMGHCSLHGSDGTSCNMMARVVQSMLLSSGMSTARRIPECLVFERQDCQYARVVIQERPISRTEGRTMGSIFRVH